MTARVLVVDDVPTNVKLLQAKLASEYFDVITAEDGPSALEITDSQSPDIILLDVMMPHMDGYEVCRRIRANPKTTHIPVIMVTALGDVSDRVRGLEAGADDFLTKPVNETALFARVRSLVRLKTAMDELRLRQQTSEQLGAIDADLVMPSPEDVSGARMLFVDNDDPDSPRIVRIAEEAGYQLAMSDDAGAPAQAAADDFDLVLISLRPSGRDGLRVASQLRSQEQTRSVPILMLVDPQDTEGLAKGLEIGINDYLVRPSDRQEVLARLRTQVRRKRYQDQLRANYRESLSMAVTDGLTGLYNRRYFDVHIRRQLTHATESEKTFALLMIDVDHFKAVNDTHGHEAGDEVLVELAKRVMAAVRNVDMVARLGGEEFVVVMPDSDAEVAVAVAERLRRAVAGQPVPRKAGGDPLDVTASIGVAVYTPDGDDDSELLARADKAMYEAKRRGRNQVYLAPDGGTPAAA